MNTPYISIVIPVHNEEDCLEILYQRLTKVMDTLEKPYEIILTNDGSRDKSESILNELQQRRPEHIRIIHFNGNFGQHMAIMAGFERVHGEIVITMDADLQNPPEEIPRLVATIEQGHDVVGGYRQNRQDKAWRKLVSKWHNQVRARITPNIQMEDEGCMLRAYRRNIVELMIMSGEASTFIPALAASYATNPIDIPVAHESRAAGDTSYTLYSLIRYNFDLVTGFSLVPLQIFTFIGIGVSCLSTLFFVYLLLRRLFIGPEVEGVFTLFSLLFLVCGIVLMGLGIIGEYIGRIYQEVRKRPRFVIRETREQKLNRKTVSPVTEAI